ncbi:MAG: disulfide bond formation protein B [Alphaproteobacteria bacterium]|uniref:Membrane protein n=1 Tax=Pseudorhizobium pelagicum TaxID=1509405 RepID=A0A922P3G6_9HYPH|nr:disulfide bond formation protein B [Pseudorhizobium pelagicum]MBU1313485.1 disulfide bond formation protein B [Alphaproteobacteria bacterium]MDY6961014.1 disulfide bond formation protein B [Pseudomonadota bacterium]KEQ07201.1 membrane protein [Pseudorhizobium pelagicum]KEQ10146.1 membrane protein [Pseudorhizobium pelagicum]MBU1549054.1 disulfide bond formation protein B [Alphaproteobacteria bacterium]|tara:strand:- start:4395 stop:4916 length:522 start_codon:yes stop_codon:yes gene_type:complete
MAPVLSNDASRTYAAYAAALTLGMVATVGGALGFQHIGGYIPCALCLLQRDPYYYGIPVGIAAVLAASFRLPAWTVRSLLVVVGLLMLVGAGMGVYHSGVEWGFWEGPATCATSVTGTATNAGSLLDDLNAFHGPSCTEASLRVLGLSFAGWNVIASLILAAIAFLGASRKPA